MFLMIISLTEKKKHQMASGSFSGHLMFPSCGQRTVPWPCLGLDGDRFLGILETRECFLTLLILFFQNIKIRKKKTQTEKE